MHASFAGGAILWAIVSFIIYSAAQSILKSRRNAAKAKELKCLPPPSEKASLPLGIDLIRKTIKADQDKAFPIYIQQRHEEVGALTFGVTILGSYMVSTCDEKLIQTILANQFADFDLGTTRRGNFMPLLGDGIFTQDGKSWEHSRAMMRPQFVRDQVSDLDLEERHVQNLMKALVPNATDNWTSEVDLQVLFFRLTLDSATEFLFGESVDSQLTDLSKNSPNTNSSGADMDFATAFDRGQMALATRARFADKYWLFSPPGFKDSCKACHKFIDHFVQLALSKDLREKDLEKSGSVKSKYVFLEALAAETRDPDELRYQLLHILLAGRDTTASLLGWLFFSLARDPARYAKLRAVVLADFGSYASAGPHNITFSKLKSCTYLQQCMNESLRLYPVVPSNGRMANKDTTLPRGGGPDGQSKIFVPKGTMVNYNVYTVHRRKDIWGPDAEEFRPERWEGRKVGWEYLPFNGGPRICIGQQFALTEASYVTVRLLQRFGAMQDLDPVREAKHNLTLTDCSANGVKVRLREG